MRRGKTGCACRSLLLRRIFADCCTVSGGRRWGPMALAVLWGIGEEGATVLLRMGFVEEVPRMPWTGADEVSTAAVLRFLERDGAWLALLRWETQIASLRALLARERRAKARRRRRAPARARKA